MIKTFKASYFISLALLLISSIPTFAATWFVRADGAIIYRTGLPGDSCDGQGDNAVTIGGGPNQHCAVMDFRYLYDNGSYGNFVWAIAGGDTVVVRGCHAASDQQNPDNPHCRVGYDTATGSGSSAWCLGSVSNRSCSTPNVPSGTAGAHTKILGACAYGTYTCTPIRGDNYPYTGNNLTQIFGGWAVGQVFALHGSDYVDIEGIELTAHNSGCVEHGTPAWPKGCVSSPTADDYASQGLATDAGTTHLLLQDVYIHGFSSAGIFGSVGSITINRVGSDFNGFAGFNMDDSGASNGPNATLDQTNFSMIGNGCNEEYPIVHTLFPAKSCYDTDSAGFGDAWSGQTCNLADPNCFFLRFTCIYCWIANNTKDGAMGPHVPIANLSLTYSYWAGNKGAAGKWGVGPGGIFLYQNNITIANCERLESLMPGAAQNFSISTGLNGSYLNGCRFNDMFAFNESTASNSEISNNTFGFVRSSDSTAQEVAFDLGCTSGSDCSAAPFHMRNNIFLGYPSSDLTKPALFVSTVTVTVANNVEYNMRAGETCGVNGVICSSPLLLNQPALGLPAANMDVFTPGNTSGAHLTSESPARGAGVNYSGQPTNDYYLVNQTSPLTIGGVVFSTINPASKIKQTGRIKMTGRIKY